MKHSLSILLFSILLWSCSESGTSYKPLSTGEYGEIYIVGENELLTDDVKLAFGRALATTQNFIGAPEPYFKLTYLSPGMARGSLLYEGTMIVLGGSKSSSQIHKVLPKKLDSIYSARSDRSFSSFSQDDLWSTPQRILFMVVNNKDSLVSYLENHGDALLATMLKKEREEAISKMTYLPDKNISKEIEKLQQVTIKAPITYHIASNVKLNDNEGLVWLREDGDFTDLNIVVHYEPYTDTVQLSLPYMIARRDSVEKKVITGEAKDSYMATDNQFRYHAETINFNGHYAKAYYGYWTLENDFMGGPYYSITAIDEKNNRVVTMEGFVYAPKYDKTKYLRELQGILYGIQF